MTYRLNSLALLAMLCALLFARLPGAVMAATGDGSSEQADVVAGPSDAVQDGTGFLQHPVAYVPEKQSLVDLVGKSEISVLENVDWRFVKSMDETQVLGEEFASQAGATDLSRSIRAGRSFSRESLAASARTEQAKARTGQALGLLLPSVSVRANYGSETSIPSVELDEEGNPIAKDTHDRTDIAWTLRQPLFDLPTFLDWRRRQVVEQASRESYRVSDGDAYLSTVNAYLTLVSTRLHTDLTRDFEKQLADLLSYIEKRAKGGAASVSDMARVRARSQQTLSFRLEQEAAHEAAGIDFVRLTNLVPSKVRLPTYQDVGVDSLPETFNAAVSTSMKQNPEVAGLVAEIKAADLDKSAAKSQFLPRLDAEYTDTYSLHAGGDTDSDGQRDKRGMLVFSWSPLNGGRDYEYYLERTARHKELQYRLDDERRRVIQALSANYSTLAITGERINSGYRELKSISLAVDAMSRRMLSGNQSLLDLLDVYDRFYQARSNLVDLHILEIYTMAQLVRLTTGSPAVIPNLNLASGQDEPRQTPDAAPVTGGPDVVAESPQSAISQGSPGLSPLPETVAVPAASPGMAVLSEMNPEIPAAEVSSVVQATVAAVAVPQPVSPREEHVIAPVEGAAGRPREEVFHPESAALERAGVVGQELAPADKAVIFREPREASDQSIIDLLPGAPPEIREAGSSSIVSLSAVPFAEEQRNLPHPPRPAPAVAGESDVRAIDDAYAPLWMDIVPNSGTAFAVKNPDGAGTSAGSGAVSATPVQTASSSAEQRPKVVASGSVSGEGVFTLGLLDTGDQTQLDRFVAEVESKLGQPVHLQLFADEKALVNWFRRLRIVDMVVITAGERGDLLAGDYSLLQTMPQPVASPRREILVARRDLPPARLKRLEQLFGAAR